MTWINLCLLHHFLMFASSIRLAATCSSLSSTDGIPSGLYFPSPFWMYRIRTIVDVGKREGVDLIMITSQGRSGMDLFLMGSVVQRVVHLFDNPVYIIPINKELAE